MDLILIDSFDVNFISNCFNAQNILVWNISKLEYWNYIFDLVDSFSQDNACIISFKHFMWNLWGRWSIVLMEVFILIKEKYHCINSIPLYIKN
jgi:hypothetical protein